MYDRVIAEKIQLYHGVLLDLKRAPSMNLPCEKNPTNLVETDSLFATNDKCTDFFHFLNFFRKKPKPTWLLP